MKLLLHTCCAPCLVSPLEDIVASGGIKPTVFFYNPNIHPYLEFKERLKSLREFLCSGAKIDSIIDADYRLEDFLRRILERPEGTDRCRVCYEIRLEKTARAAFDMGFDAFSTTLFVSPYQKHDLIIETGKRLMKTTGVLFLEKDWRGVFRQGREKAREMSLYMQKYCGCIFSEEERFRKKMM